MWLTDGVRFTAARNNVLLHFESLPTTPSPPPPTQIHGGLLGVRGSASHEADMAAHGIRPIDIVLVRTAVKLS